MVILHSRRAYLILLYPLASALLFDIRGYCMTGRVAPWDGHLLARHVMSSSYTLYYTIGMKWLGDAQEGIKSVLWLTRLLDCGCDVVICASKQLPP
jgi:hypothetical protein